MAREDCSRWSWSCPASTWYIWLSGCIRLSNKSRRLHRFGGSHFTEVSPLQQDWWVFFHTFYMSMCAQLESYRGQKELYTELSIVSAKVGNQFFSNARVPLLLANVEIWCKKTTCSETGRVFCFDRFCSADIFSWGKTCTNKTHVPFYNNNIYIYTVYIYFFSLSLSLMCFFKAAEAGICPCSSANRAFNKPSLSGPKQQRIRLWHISAIQTGNGQFRGRIREHLNHSRNLAAL
jgi:hypothetical protein